MPDICVEKYLPDMVAMRRKLHTYPEEGWTEFVTTTRIIEALRAMGLEPKFGKDVIDVKAVMGRREAIVEKAWEAAHEVKDIDQTILDSLDRYTGAMVEIDTGRPGPCTALRFDIDCVVNTETDDPNHAPNAQGFASTRPGLMHSCGHDAHTALGLGVARWVADHKDELKGRIKIVFQPAEEGVRGASPMAQKGIVDDADYLVGSHVGCEFGLGEVGVLKHGYLATTKMDITFEGRSAHAGSDPEKGRSALVAAAATVMALQGISRHSGGDSRVAVGTLHAGEGRNVVAAKATMQVEVRGATTEVNQFMTDEVYRIVRGMSEVYGVKGTIEKMGEASVYECDEEVCTMLMQAAQEIPEIKKSELFETCRGSEDCSMLANRVREKGGKAGYFCWGCDHHGHHRPDFDVQDTESLNVGFKMTVGFIKKANG